MLEEVCFSHGLPSMHEVVRAGPGAPQFPLAGHWLNVDIANNHLKGTEGGPEGLSAQVLVHAQGGYACDKAFGSSMVCWKVLRKLIPDLSANA